MINKFIVLILLFSLSSCLKDNSSPNPTKSKYKYYVSGTSGSYSVTIENANNNTQQFDPIGNGWAYTWEQTGKRWLYLSAQNNNSTGTVVVRIYKDGVIIASNKSVGGHTIADVSGTY